MIRVFCDYTAQLYTFWLAVLIKQIIKNPIAKLNALIKVYHAVTIVLAILLTTFVGTVSTFGVEV